MWYKDLLIRKSTKLNPSNGNPSLNSNGDQIKTMKLVQDNSVDSHGKLIKRSQNASLESSIGSDSTLMNMLETHSDWLLLH